MHIRSVVALCAVGAVLIVSKPETAVAFQNLNHCGALSHTMSSDGRSGSFYVNNTCNVRICVSVSVENQRNAVGSVISGVLLMRPNEGKHLVGSFRAANNRAWNVNVRARATDECY